MFRANTSEDISQKEYEHYIFPYFDESKYIYRSYTMLLLSKINIAQNIKK